LVGRRRQPVFVFPQLQRRLLGSQSRLFNLPGNRLLPLLQGRGNRAPGKFEQDRQQEQEHDEREDRHVKPEVGRAAQRGGGIAVAHVRLVVLGVRRALL